MQVVVDAGGVPKDVVGGEGVAGAGRRGLLAEKRRVSSSFVGMKTVVWLRENGLCDIVGLIAVSEHFQ